MKPLRNGRAMQESPHTRGKEGKKQVSKERRATVQKKWRKSQRFTRFVIRPWATVICGRIIEQDQGREVCFFFFLKGVRNLMLWQWCVLCLPVGSSAVITSCATMGKLFNLSVPRFPPL